MKVSEEYEDSNLTTSLNLGLNVLYQIATLPEPEHTKEHITSNGENKTPDEKSINLTQNSILSLVKLHILVI
ncbi:hypothetical protein Q0P09_14060 [Staphylococcus aureus]|uniref:hypothetical protein n=1 Tax=Staphylococcus aureus TaxID=1280 RepID=UPI00214951CA|nr:hypothetical protein [Staphylococcus aureus]MCQ9952489.1 hypothetical protein [Staphylococcus aureus]MCQ9982130.1 hypothetical protein [Staphylococcus aureus]MDN8937260.1 hypothetical protein [Staphylococcus aureus]MDN8974725.1 hypothetical protein [Staphylococcus aureus]